MLKAFQIIERTVRMVGVFGAWLFVPLMAIIVVGVFARYLFNSPLEWGYDVGYMLTGTIFILGNGYALQEERHIRLDFFYGKLGCRGKAIVDVLGYCFLFLPLGWWTTWGLGGYTLQAYLSGRTTADSAWSPVVWPFRAILCFGFLILTLQATVNAIKAIACLLGKNPGESRQ